MGSSPRTKWKSSKSAFHTVLIENDLEGIADRVYGTMTEPLTVITTMQEVLKQMIETQLMELKTLMSHAPQVATSSTTPNLSHRSRRKSEQVCRSHTNQHTIAKCERRTVGRYRITRFSCAALGNTKNPIGTDRQRV